MVLLLLLLLQSFSHQRFLMVFHWSLSHSKSAQVSRTLLSILDDLNYVLVWMVSTRPVISQSLYQSFGDCTKGTNYDWYNGHFNIPQFFQFSSKVVILIFIFNFSQFYNYYFYYYFKSCEFLTSVFAGCISLESEWQHVSSSLQDSSQYSGRSQYCCRIDGFHSSSYF